MKVYGVQALLGRLVSSDRFDRVLDGLTVTAIDTGAGTVECELKVGQAVQNSYGTLHGGAIATIVDVVGTMALLTKDPLRAGVSVDLNVTYMAAAKAEEKVIVRGRALKTGKKVSKACWGIRDAVAAGIREGGSRLLNAFTPPPLSIIPHSLLAAGFRGGHHLEGERRRAPGDWEAHQGFVRCEMGRWGGEQKGRG